MVWLNSKRDLLHYADSIYRLMEEKSQLRFKAGETNVLEKSASQSARQFYTNQLNMLELDVDIALRSFNALLQDDKQYSPQKTNLKMDLGQLLEVKNTDDLPMTKVWKQEAEAAKWRWKTEKARLMPDLNLGYNNLSISGFQTNAAGQEMYYDSGNRFSYITAGVSVPLFFGSQSAKSKAAKAEYQNLEAQSEAVKIEVSAQIQNASKEVQKFKQSLQYYENEGLANAQTIIDAANSQLRNGDIDYLQWVLVVNQAITIKNEHLDTVNNYNKALITLQTITNL